MQALTHFNAILTREAFQSGNLTGQQQIDLESYFRAVYERNRNGEQFPYDLEELIPTAFTDKARAVDALKAGFMEGVDFIGSTVRSNGNPKPKAIYKLSPSCFEFMAARKCRPVFEVYRQVFHRTAEQALPPTSINVRDPQQLAVIATQLAQLTQELQADLGKAQHQIEQDRPKVRLAEQFCSTDNTHSLIAAAAHFGGKPGQPGTVKALKNFLRTQGLWKSRLFGMANDEPTAKAIDRGFFICREIEIVANGIPRMIPDWRFTQRGMLAIERLIHAPLESTVDQAGLF